jgi:hypothetical protein
MVCDPDKVAARKPPAAATGTKPDLAPRLGRHRSVPPA